ncbi:MAG: tetratricopeptide repeat protein, partial [Myxococcota bacterium]
GDAPLGERAEALQVPGGFALGPISPLEEEDVATVLHVLLPDLAEAPAPLVAAITHRSKGNPGAIRQLVFALLETSLFVRDEDTGLRVDLDQLAGGDLPVTLEDAIQLRLDALNAFQRETLARAATVGDRFWDGAILAQMRSERDIPGERTDPTSIWPNDEDLAALHQALTILVERGFVEQQEPSDLPGALEFSFQMSGVRDRTYLTADESLRILRHTAVARWLAVTAELRREGIAALIAPHLEEAGMPRRAGRAYLEAASYERKHLRTSTALRYIEKALPLISSDDVVRKIDAYHEHGSLLSTVGRYDDAIDNFTDMLRLAWGIGARGKGGAALNRIARVHRQRGEVQSAESILTRALSMFRTAGDLRGVAATLDDLAQVYNLLGDSKRALSAGGEALEIRRAHRDKRGEAVSLHTLASIELNRGNLNRCEEFFRQSLTIREEIRDLEGIMQSHNALGILAFERGDKATAAEAWKAALSTAEEMADRRNQSYLLNNIGEAYIAQNRLEDAAASLARARAHATELGDKRALAEIERNLGWVAVKRGGDDAEETLERALRLAKEYGAKDMIAAAYRAIGQLRAQTLFDASGEADLRAEENFLTSIDLYREIGNEKEAARSLASLGFHLIERGEMETAKERLHEARAIMRGMGLAELERVDRTLAELGA